MDNDKTADVDPPEDDESIAEYKEDVENDPSTAKPSEPDSDDLDRLRGG